MRLARLFYFFVLLPSVASAAAIATFDSAADSPYNLQSFGADVPTIEPNEGNPGSFLQLTTTVLSQNTAAVFDLTDPGTFPRITFSFDFRCDLLGGGGADGFSFNFFDTSRYQTSGPFLSQPFPTTGPEDPVAAGVLGIGFDTWGNANVYDVGGSGENYSEISLFYNSRAIKRIADTRTLPTGAFNLKDGAWHTVTGVVDFLRGTLTMDVDTTSIFADQRITGLAQFENRIGFNGRTGGSNERTSIDNIQVFYAIPEPGAAALLAIGGLLAARRRREVAQVVN